MTLGTIDYRVQGKVQGVYFRNFAKETGEALGVVGWVKNELSGDVVGTAQGSEEALHKFKEALHEGPPDANITRVEFTNEAPLDQLQYHGFEKIRNQRKS